VAMWPSGVPFFVVEAEQTGPTNNVIRTTVDVGPAQRRRRSTAAVRRVTARTPFLTKAQSTTFETFFRDTIADGALSFTATDPLDCTAKTWAFVGSYRKRRVGAAFVYTAELEVLP